MKLSKQYRFALALLIIGLALLSIETPVNAATILGKTAILTSSTKQETYPLVSGNKMTFEHKAIIRINGGTLVAEKGTILAAFDQGNKVIFQIEKGIINFRIQPHKTIVSFNTKDGVIFSPEIVKANESMIEGRIVVTDTDTILELSEGALEALTPEGPTTIKAGETFLLAAQAVIDESDGELADATDSNNPSDDDMNADDTDDTDSSSTAATVGVVGTATTAAIVGPIVAATTSNSGGAAAAPGEAVASE